MKYDDIESRSTPSAAIISMVLITLAVIGTVVYLILNPEAADSTVLKSTSTDVQVNEKVDVVNENVDGIDWEAKYHSLLEERTAEITAMTRKVLDANRFVSEFKQASIEKEEAYKRQIRVIEEERDEYKRAYEELESYANEMIEFLKGL